MAKVLSELLVKCKKELVCGDPDVFVESIQFDSRKIEHGSAFFAIPGTQVDGHKFIPKAIKLGASAVVCECVPDRVPDGITVFRVSSASDALGWAANAFYDYPSSKLKLLGITGTNGKTTTVTLLYQLFSSAGFACGLLSTVRNLINDREIPATHTTADALQIAKLMSEMVDSGCSYCFMEVTSHAIHQNRISGLDFDAALFSNISHDHLDYHETFEAYRDVKKKYFDDLPQSASAVFNANDAHGAYMVRDCKCQKISYGEDRESDYEFSVRCSNLSGMTLDLCGRSFDVQLVGDFNAYNMVACLAAAEQLGLPLDQSIQYAKLLEPVSGRMEKVESRGQVVGLVDFAHTPDAIEKVISAVREIEQPTGGIVTVIGCGGNRDREKRPRMAEVAYRLSDLLVITSDNPRSEEPTAIIDDMRAGLPRKFDESRLFVFEDREEAIKRACIFALDGAAVLVLGKGHEKFQLIGDEKYPLDDVEVLRNALEERG